MWHMVYCMRLFFHIALSFSKQDLNENGMHAASCRYGHGVDPDLTCLCKGIANGHPLSAVLGRDGPKGVNRRAAARLRATGSFWANAVPFAAALATIPQAAPAAATAEAMGLRLRAGMLHQAAACGLADDFVCSGPPQMPYWYFRSETARSLNQRYRILVFCAACTEGGVWMHPFHTNFLGGAHTADEIDATLRVTARAFAKVADFSSKAAKL
jgi:glutamate-1-semialdehyde 2,1-aminomutase